jgi:hypothetical protein
MATVQIFVVTFGESKILEYRTTVKMQEDGLLKGKGKMHPCTDTEALYWPYGP